MNGDGFSGGVSCCMIVVVVLISRRQTRQRKEGLLGGMFAGKRKLEVGRTSLEDLRKGSWKIQKGDFLF